MALLTQHEVNQKLIELGFRNQAYQIVLNNLRANQYTEEQVQSIALQQHGLDIARMVNKHHNTLTQYLSRTQITKILIASAVTLDRLIALIANKNSWHQLGFNSEQITEFLSHHGASMFNLFMISTEEMIGHGYTNEDVLALARGKTSSITSLLRCYDDMEALGFTARDMFEIAKELGAENSFEIIVSKYQLFIDLGFNNDMLLKIARRGGASNKLEALLEQAPILAESGFNTSQMTSLCLGRTTGTKMLPLISNNWPALQEFGFSPEQVSKLVSRTNEKTINALIENLNNLAERNISVATIIEKATHEKGFESISILVTSNAIAAIEGAEDDMQLDPASIPAPTPTANKKRKAHSDNAPTLFRSASKSQKTSEAVNPSSMKKK